MCHQGCRYELCYCDAAGECGLPSDKTPPVDAMCSINELQAENAELRRLVRCLVGVTHPADRAELIGNAGDAMAELLREGVD